MRAVGWRGGTPPRTTSRLSHSCGAPESPARNWTLSMIRIRRLRPPSCTGRTTWDRRDLCPLGRGPGPPLSSEAKHRSSPNTTTTVTSGRRQDPVHAIRRPSPMGHQPASGPHSGARPGRRAAGPGHAGSPDPSQRSERRRVNAAAVVVHFQDHRAGGSRYSHSRTDHDACLAADVGQRLVVSCHLPSELTHPVAAMVLADRQPCALAPEFPGYDGPSEPGQRPDPPVLRQAKIPAPRPPAHYPARHKWLASKVLLTAVRAHSIRSVTSRTGQEALTVRVCAGQGWCGGRGRS
jgi:hypothetical protein